MTADATHFGSYRLLSRLGEGAMGEVWRALDLRLEREVALKILKDADDLRRKALIGEAKLACQLNHPNIAHIYDAGEVDGTPFIAMELVEGRTLRALVGRPMNGATLQDLARQAASALSHADCAALTALSISTMTVCSNCLSWRSSCFSVALPA